MIQNRNTVLNILFVLCLFLSNASFCQLVKDKKVMDLDLYNDLSDLEAIGLNRVDVEFMWYLSANENKNLTVSGYKKNVAKYRKMPDYELLKNVFQKPIRTFKPFPDSFLIQDNFEKGKNMALSNKQDLLIIFAGHGSVNSMKLQSAIFYNAFNYIHKKYTIVWLFVDFKDSVQEMKNFDLEQSVYNTNIQPYSILYKNAKYVSKVLSIV